MNGRSTGGKMVAGAAQEGKITSHDDPSSRMPQFITFAGFSSVGKKTLIKSILAGKHHERFGITGRVEAFGCSFDPLTEMLQSRADTVLYQWQFDTHQCVQELQDAGQHRIYLLWRDYEEHHRDWLRCYRDRAPYVRETTPAHLRKKWEEVLQKFEGMDFEVVNVGRMQAGPSRSVQYGSEHRMRPTLRGSRILLRPVYEADLPCLLEILREPAVARHWNQPDDEFLAGDNADGSERITTFVIAIDDEAIGWIAGWEKLHRDYRHAGIDLFLSTYHQGKGYGTEAIRLVCRFLFEERRHHRVTADPAADNVNSIRAFEKVGFRRVGVMRQYERGADGTFHDGMLLNLLPEELK